MSHFAAHPRQHKLNVAGSHYAMADNRVLIVHAVYRLDVGGMENGLVNLINRMPVERFRHAVVCLTHSTEFANRIQPGDVDVIELHKKPGKDLSIYPRFLRLMRKLKPQILHTRNLGTIDLAPIGALARVPIRVHGEHGWSADDPKGLNPRHRLIRRLCDWSISQYVAVSADIAQWLGDVIAVRTSKVRHICNGVDIDKFSSVGAKAVLPFEGGDDRFVIGSIGRMDPIKNFDLLLDAIAQLVAHHKNLRDVIRVVLVGDGPELSPLRQRAQSLGVSDIVYFPGARSDVADIMRCMDLFVLPSRNEGISNTVLEAMASGLPVIATNVGGNPELVADCETGALIEANDAQAIAQAITRYLGNHRLLRDHGLAARESVERRLSLPSMVTSYQEMYDEMLSLKGLTGIH